MPSNPHDERDNAVPASVGIVETRFARLFSDDHPLQFQIGAELASVTVAYETYGTLNANKNNAVYVCHALTGDAHAAGLHSADDEKPGWWDGFIGPGKALDTNEYFVIGVRHCQRAFGTGAASRNQTAAGSCRRQSGRHAGTGLVSQISGSAARLCGAGFGA
jgi:homoserine O-acetyltransferase/O-succinyltransferase